MSKNGSKRGRPKGSPNAEYAVVHAQPVRCPKCQSTELAAVPGAAPIEKPIAGTAPDGQRYDAMRWQRSKCLGCGQRLVIISHLSEKNNTERIISS